MPASTAVECTSPAISYSGANFSLSQNDKLGGIQTIFTFLNPVNGIQLHILGDPDEQKMRVDEILGLRRFCCNRTEYFILQQRRQRCETNWITVDFHLNCDIHLSSGLHETREKSVVKQSQENGISFISLVCICSIYIVFRTRKNETRHPGSKRFTVCVCVPFSAWHCADMTILVGCLWMHELHTILINHNVKHIIDVMSVCSAWRHVRQRDKEEKRHRLHSHRTLKINLTVSSRGDETRQWNKKRNNGKINDETIYLINDWHLNTLHR